MESNKEIYRIWLDVQAAQDLKEMLEHLKTLEKHARVNMGKLASAIISDYKKMLFEKNKIELASKFFNKKFFLKDLVKNVNNEEELMAALQRRFTIDQVKRAHPKKTKDQLIKERSSGSVD